MAQNQVVLLVLLKVSCKVDLMVKAMVVLMGVE